MAHNLLSATLGSPTTHADVGESPVIPSPASCELTDPDELMVEAADSGIAVISKPIHETILPSLFHSSKDRATLKSEKCTNCWPSDPITSVAPSTSTSSIVMPPEDHIEDLTSGSQGVTYGGGYLSSSGAPRFIVPSSSKGADGLYCQQWNASTDCLSVEDYHPSRVSTSASLSGGSGSPTFLSSGFPSCSQRTNVVTAGFHSHRLLKDALPALRQLPETHLPPYMERRNGGGSVSTSSSNRQATSSLGKQREGVSPRTRFQAFSDQTMVCALAGTSPGQSPTMALAGVPVSRHFDPLRPSPFDLSKFDRRDPYAHFYIPVDCPFGRRCCDGACPLAHTKLEKIFHPIVYKTQRCQMAQMALTGRCQYVHKCAFFHTEEDKREAELQWRVWEAQWASWRNQIDQLLLNHYKLEKEIRRKVEGILKIRMPRPTTSDATGPHFSFGTIGAPVEFQEQPETLDKQTAGTLSISKVGRMAAAWSSTGSVGSPASGGFADLAASQTRPANRHANASSHPVQEKAVASGSIRQIRCPTPVERNTLLATEHQVTTHLQTQQDWYLSGRGDGSVVQRHTPGRDASFEARVRPGLEDTLSTRATFQYPHELSSIPEFDEQISSEVTWSFAAHFSRNAHSEQALHGVSVQLAYPNFPHCNTSAASKELGCRSVSEVVPGIELLVPPNTWAEEEVRTQASPDSHPPFCQPASQGFALSKMGTVESIGQGEVQLAEVEVELKARDQAPKDHVLGNTIYPTPLNFFYPKQQQYTRSEEGSAVVDKIAGVGQPTLTIQTYDHDDPNWMVRGTDGSTSSQPPKLTRCEPSSCSATRGCGSGADVDVPSNGPLINRCINANPSERASRRHCPLTTGPGHQVPLKTTSRLRRGAKTKPSKGGGKSVASHEDAGEASFGFEAPRSALWQQHRRLSNKKLNTPLSSSSSSGTFGCPTDVPTDGRDSGSIDVPPVQQRVASEGEGTQPPEDELHLLTRDLGHLLREVAEEIRRLEVMNISGSTVEKLGQPTSRMILAPTDLTAGGSTERPYVSEPSNANGRAEVGTDPRASPAFQEGQRLQCSAEFDAPESFDAHAH